MQSTFCSFKATIIRIDNIDQPWYDACKVCGKKVFKTEQGAECNKCAKSNPEHHPRYNNLFIKGFLNVIGITLFSYKYNYFY